MLKGITTTLSFFSLILLVSCSTDHEAYVEKLEECQANLKENSNSEHGSLDEAIGAYDFEMAHKVLTCYGDETFHSDGDLYVHKSAPLRPRDEAVQRLADAETRHLIGLGEFEKAINAHEELVGSSTYESYNEPTVLIGASDRFLIYKKAVITSLEKGDRPTAEKWAKRAPRDFDREGKDIKKRKSESQSSLLLKIIEDY
jgi:hypothetical protein